jgi:hypothetical protein
MTSLYMISCLLCAVPRTDYSSSSWRAMNSVSGQITNTEHAIGNTGKPTLLFSVIDKGGHANYFFTPQIANPRILGLIPQSKIRKFLRCASPQIANPQICNDYSVNRKSANILGVPDRKSQIRKFASKTAAFLIQIYSTIFFPLIFVYFSKESMY